MLSYFILGLILALIVTTIVYAIGIYNNFISLENNIKKNWANIDVLLKQRHDELPKLIETCKQYMKHERETFETITKARSNVFNASKSGNLKQLGEAENILRSGLSGLFAVVENYPDLKANQSFQQLQIRIVSLENQIADRREFYNESVTINNTRLRQFPDVIIANYFKFKTHELLEFDVSDLQDIDMATLFK